MPSVEKRWSPRNKFFRKVEVVPHNAPFARLVSDDKPKTFWSQDISKGGMSLQTNQSLPASAVVKLNFQYLEKKPMNVFAKVVWTRANECGLKFMAFEDRRSS